MNMTDNTEYIEMLTSKAIKTNVGNVVMLLDVIEVIRTTAEKAEKKGWNEALRAVSKLFRGKYTDSLWDVIDTEVMSLHKD